jgi:Flp pilus assembly protein TadG
VNSRRSQRGQAIVEMGLVVLLFTVLTLGIVDFGRMLMILNVVTHAARDGARAASVTTSDAWSGGTLSGTALDTIEDRVHTQLATVLSADDANAFTVTPSLADVGGIIGQEVSVTVAGTVPYLFGFSGIWGGEVAVNRVATFRFEG